MVETAFVVSGNIFLVSFGNHLDQGMENLLGSIWGYLRKCMYFVLSFGPMPTHIAFIMDGNRRFAKNHSSMKEGSGHSAGFSALVSILQHCYEMGVKYVTVYAFSIDNFKRNPDEVQSLMDLMQVKIDELLRKESVVSKYGVRINFWGNLDLLSDPVRSAAKRAMLCTARNTGPVLSVCVAYTSSYEIVHAIQESVLEKRAGVANIHYSDQIREDVILAGDLERHLFTTSCPDPDILIRSSGESRLSNFLLWQTTFSHLQNPGVLWPQFTFRHLIWSVLQYQRVCGYLKGRMTSINSEVDHI